MSGVPSFATRTATVIARGAPDRYGDPGPETRTHVQRCAIHPAGSTENTDRAQRTTAQAVLIGPVTTALTQLRPADAIEVDGTRWEVDGVPEVWTGHVKVHLHRVRG
ncbi:MAG: hypothetical protein ACT4NY_09060 [Pseudonocardiales bacterium]